MVIKEFKNHSSAVADTVLSLHKDYYLNRRLLQKGQVISSKSRGDWLLAEGEKLRIKAGPEEKKIVIPENKTVTIFISPGQEYFLKAESNIHLTSLLQKQRKRSN